MFMYPRHNQWSHNAKKPPNSFTEAFGTSNYNLKGINNAGFKLGIAF